MTDHPGPAATSQAPSPPSQAPPSDSAVPSPTRVHPPVPSPMIILNILMAVILLAVLIWQQIVFQPLWKISGGNDRMCLIWCTVWMSRYLCGAGTETLYFIFLQRNLSGVSFLRLIKTLLSVFSFAWWLYGVKPVLVDSISNVQIRHWSRGLWYAHLTLMIIPCLCTCTVLGLYCCGVVSLVGPREEPSANQKPTPQEVIDKLTVKKFRDIHITTAPGTVISDLGGPSTDSSTFSNLVALPHSTGPPSAVTLAQMSAIISPIPISMNLQRAGSRPFGRANTYRDRPACPVCFSEFEADDDVVCMPCDERHVFHVDCIKHWLEKSQCCPICRANIAELLADDKEASATLRNDKKTVADSPV